jgi:hypothetical protein
VAKTLGALVSAAIWVISVVVWGLVALMRWVSWVLNLNVSMLWNFPFASTLGVGALLAAIGTFQAARSRAAGIGGFGGLLALGGYLLFVHPWLTKNLAAIMPLGLSPVSSDQFGGFLLAIVIGVTAITGLAAAGHPAGAWPPVRHVPGENPFGGLHRVHPRRAADHAAVHRLAAAGNTSCRRRPTST